MTDETDEARQARIDMAVTKQLERAIAKNTLLYKENKLLRKEIEELRERLKDRLTGV